MATNTVRFSAITLAITSILFFIISIYLYPGGDIDGHATSGFQFSKNYICNLFADSGLNGKINYGKYFSLTATILLAFSFILTFILIPRYISIEPNKSTWIYSLGFVSMAMACFISSDYHDTVINISGALGSISLLIVLKELYHKRIMVNLLLCLCALVSSGITYFVYYFTSDFHVLAILQKISILIFIVWLFHTHFSLYKTGVGNGRNRIK